MKKFIQMLFVATALQGCTNNDKSLKEAAAVSVYKREREFTFLASHFKNDGKLSESDTLILTTSSDVWREDNGQTRISWTSIGGARWKSITGVIENDTAVWIHPPRNGLYRKLELSPFPMVKFPLKVGNRWTWSLLIGNQWGVKGHAEWADTLNEQFISNYKITREVPITTKLGVMNCFEIESFTESNFGETELKAYYSTAYGFVRLEYRNMDKGRLTVELVKERAIQPALKLPFKDFGTN